MSTSLDRRAEAAADAVRAAVAHLEPPQGEVPAPRHRRWPVLAAAVALAAVAVAGAVLVERDGDRDVVAGPSGALPRLVADDPPDDLSAAVASELPAAGTTASSFRLYGRGDANDPVRDGDVGIFVMRGGGSFNAPGEEVRVRGVQGTLGEQASYGWSLVWNEAGLGSVLVQSRSLSGQDLLPLAEGMRREGDGLVLDRPPGGYRLVADLPGPPGLTLGIMVPGDRGSTVRYSADGGRFLALMVTEDRPGALEAFRWLGGTRVRATTVRGHDAWFLPASADDEPFELAALGWREQPGVFVSVAGSGLTEEELRAAAEGLRPATDEEWEELVAAADDDPVASSDEDMPTLAEGPSWRYARDGDEGVCFEVVDGGVPSGTCYSDPPRLSEGAEQSEDGWWFHGRVSDAVVRVSVQQGGSDPRLTDTVPMEGGGRAWAVRLPDGGSTRITALDAAGAVLEQTTHG
jgi:hypothetical protein